MIHPSNRWSLCLIALASLSNIYAMIEKSKIDPLDEIIFACSEGRIDTAINIFKDFNVKEEKALEKKKTWVAKQTDILKRDIIARSKALKENISKPTPEVEGETGRSEVRKNFMFNRLVHGIDCAAKKSSLDPSSIYLSDIAELIKTECTEGNIYEAIKLVRVFKNEAAKRLSEKISVFNATATSMHTIIHKAIDTANFTREMLEKADELGEKLEEQRRRIEEIKKNHVKFEVTPDGGRVTLPSVARKVRALKPVVVAPDNYPSSHPTLESDNSVLDAELKNKYRYKFNMYEDETLGE